ncbi:MAG TPA: T9SS type A sorting domain-containing protein, partial [Paludibacteraceae bacterium]|nr:T9SS type A sorting domain-containing protein [Paludibacteraceae bacterium]HON01708.1 T9SS type A sorting domain-containing protein [Paludibacteraceae bacterium]
LLNINMLYGCSEKVRKTGGLSTVSVIDTKGAVVKTIQNVGAESVTFDVANKGLYMVRVQNSGKSATLKVVL